MSMLLARLARTLTHHWIRGAARRRGRDRPARRLAAGDGGEAVDDFSAPGTETQQAIDLFKAHSPAFAGADSTLVYSVEQGKLTDPGPRAAVEAALAKVKTLEGVVEVGDPFAEGGACRRTAGSRRSTSATTLDPSEHREGGRRGAARRRPRPAERERRRGRRARHADRLRLRAGRRRSASSSAC